MLVFRPGILQHYKVFHDPQRPWFWDKGTCCDCYLTKLRRWVGFVSNWSGKAGNRMLISELPSLCFIPEITLQPSSSDCLPGYESMGGSNRDT